MPDNNNPTSWPPEPQASKPETTKQPVNKIAGWISLILASLGAVALIVPIVMARIYVARYGVTYVNISLPSSFPQLLWWTAALVTGIIGRRSLTGKLGLSIIGIMFAAFIIIFILVAYLHKGSLL